jgi:hypothetical protein
VLGLQVVVSTKKERRKTVVRKKDRNKTELNVFVKP